MRGESNAPFGQHHACVLAHLPVEPRIWLWQFWPGTIVQSTQNKQVSALNARL